jgi:hypothetical protein
MEKAGLADHMKNEEVLHSVKERNVIHTARQAVYV